MSSLELYYVNVYDANDLFSKRENFRLHAFNSPPLCEAVSGVNLLRINIINLPKEIIKKTIYSKKANFIVIRMSEDSLPDTRIKPWSVVCLLKPVGLTKIG